MGSSLNLLEGVCWGSHGTNNTKYERSRGFTAHLELDTHAGQAYVGLKVMLGNVQQQHPSNSNSKPSRKRSPSYFRRQERRQFL